MVSKHRIQISFRCSTAKPNESELMYLSTSNESHPITNFILPKYGLLEKIEQDGDMHYLPTTHLSLTGNKLNISSSKVSGKSSI